MKNTNLEQYQSSFLNKLELEGKSFNTIKNYRTDLNIFKGFLSLKGKNFDLNELNEIQVKEYDLYLEKKYTSPNSIRRRVQALRIFFDFLISEQVFDENPIKKIVSQPKVVDLPRPAKFSDIKNLLKYLSCSDELNEHEKLLFKRNKLLVYLIYGGGLKVSDLENLELQHISQNKKECRVLIIREKRDPISVILPTSFGKFYPDYLSDLERAKQRDKIDFKEVLFNANPFRILSGGLSSRGTEVIFKELSKMINTTITAKSLRQSAIFYWLALEIPDSRIKEWMGVQPQYSLKPYKDLLKNYPEKYFFMDLENE